MLLYGHSLKQRRDGALNRGSHTGMTSMNKERHTGRHRGIKTGSKRRTSFLAAYATSDVDAASDGACQWQAVLEYQLAAGGSSCHIAVCDLFCGCGRGG